MAEFPRYPLGSVVPLKPDYPGQVRVLLTCGCGHPTDFTYEASATGETGRSYTCEGCQGCHWFRVGGDAIETGD